MFGTFEKPSVARNRGGYDYSLYLYSQRIYGSIYVKTVNDVCIIGHKFDLINLIRNSIRTNLSKLLPKDEFRHSVGFDCWRYLLYR